MTEPAAQDFAGPAAIVAAITFDASGVVPEAALRAATVRRTEVAPLLIEAVEAWIAGDRLCRDELADAVYGAFLLFSQWRELAALRPLVRMLGCNRDDLGTAFGDVGLDAAARVLAALCDGDPQPLFTLILSSDADETYRSLAAEALALAVAWGTLPREPVVRFLRGAHLRLQADAGQFVWYGWQRAISLLGLSELTPLVKDAFERDCIDPTFLGFDDFTRDLMRTLSDPANPPWLRDGEFAPINDAVAYLNDWMQPAAV